MDVRYKLRRVNRWGSAFGYLEALRFELMWSCKRPLVGVSIPGHVEPLLVRRGFTDLSVFETVFLNRELETRVPEDPHLIIDGGAYVGYSTVFFARQFPDATVVAIEPSGANIAMLRANCRGLENVTVVEGGLWPFSCRLRIANPAESAWSFRCEPAPDGAPGSFPATSVEDLINQSGHQRCDLLKLDVEGAEEQLFADAERWLSRVDVILVEVHGPRAGAAIEAACPSRDWAKTVHGEKLLMVSRARLGNVVPGWHDPRTGGRTRTRAGFWRRHKDAPQTLD